MSQKGGGKYPPLYGPPYSFDFRLHKEAKTMRELIEFMAKSLVDRPEEVEVTERRFGDRVVYQLHVAESDMGKVIGKQGRIAHAMRTLLKVASLKANRRATLEIGD